MQSVINMLKHAVISSFLSQTKDRFHVYNKTIGLEEKLAMIQEIGGAEAVEIVYPYEVKDPVETKALLEKYNVKVAAVNVNIKAEPEFLDGGITSLETAIRDQAVGFIKKAKGFAKAIGADKVTCCPLGDGYEYSFQKNYLSAWNRLKDSFGEAAEYYGDFPLFIEFKPSETRGRCFLDDASKTIALIQSLGRSNLGVTLDYGHSTYGGKNPSEELCLLKAAGIPFYIHINDNDGRWDWDHFVGSHHILQYIEFVYYLKLFKYDDYLTSDTSPTRLDIRRTFEVNTRLTGKIENLLDRVGMNRVGGLLAGEDFIKTWDLIENEIFSFKE